jgi:hypothetical protein
MFDIDHDVPMAKGNAGRPPVYPFNKMIVGDSFFISCFRHQQSEKANRVRRAAWRRMGKGAVSVKSVFENGVYGVRVYRVA